KLDHILAPQLQVPALGHLLAVQHRAIGALQVDQVGLHPANLVAKLVALLRVPELYDGVLLADAGVLGREIHDRQFSPDQPAAPSAKVDRVDDVLALEHEQLPRVARRRLPGLWRLVILERDGGTVGLRDRVGSRRQQSRVAVVGLLLWLLSLPALAERER